MSVIASSTVKRFHSGTTAYRLRDNEYAFANVERLRNIKHLADVLERHVLCNNGMRSWLESLPAKIQFAALIIPQEGSCQAALIGAQWTIWPRDATRASGCSARPRNVASSLSICSCPVHRNHRVKSSSTIMTASNYKALRSRRDRGPVNRRN